MCIIVIALYERHLQKKKDKKMKETQEKYRAGGPNQDLEQPQNDDLHRPGRNMLEESSKKPFA